MSKKIYIEGMSCEHCVKHVTNALMDVDGVKDVKVDLKSKVAAVDLAGGVEDGKLREAVEEAGYDVVKIEE
ncbi:MAG: heavy-metal-associated domain-containing protein [Thermoclostridium sp.]|nr:heavy-metal-associated domain-containing protein [Thermoclostridium sp.]